MPGSSPPSLPLPPAELAGYVIGDEHRPGALEAYVRQGERIRADLLRLLGPDWSFAGKRVLDFGCGSGRVLRQFEDEARSATEMHGAELDERCVRWLRETFSPPFGIEQASRLPPLGYPDGHFDLIWSTSVFTHLADEWSAWLAELHRLLAPGGRLVVSVMGASLSEQIAGEPWDPDRVGMLVLGHGRPWAAGGPMVMHSEWWLRAHWGRLFEVSAYEPEGLCGQDAVLLTRLDVPTLSPAELAEPEPSEPRELRAALHAVERLHAEYDELNAAHDRYAAAYAQESERVAALQAELGRANARLAELEPRRRGGLAGAVRARLGR